MAPHQSKTWYAERAAQSRLHWEMGSQFRWHGANESQAVERRKRCAALVREQAPAHARAAHLAQELAAQVLAHNNVARAVRTPVLHDVWNDELGKLLRHWQVSSRSGGLRRRRGSRISSWGSCYSRHSDWATMRAAVQRWHMCDKPPLTVAPLEDGVQQKAGNLTLSNNQERCEPTAHSPQFSCCARTKRGRRGRRLRGCKQSGGQTTHVIGAKFHHHKHSPHVTKFTVLS